MDRELIEAVKELDEASLRRLFILARARLESAGVDLGDAPKVNLKRRLVRCGKPTCGACPHGPYWYAYWTEGGRRRSRYVGRLLDES